MNVGVPGNDLLRAGVPQLGGPSMMNMNSHTYMQQQQHHPQGQPQQGQPTQMGLLQNNPNSNSILAGGPPNNMPYQFQMQQANLHNRQQVLMQQAQNAQGGLNRQVPPQMNSMGGHNPPLPGMGFTNGVMNPPPQQIRRVASQPTQMNHAGAHMGGMPQGMGGMGMGLNQGQMLPQHMRPGIPQQHYSQMRVAQQPQHAMQGHVSPEMSMSMSRQPQMPGNGGLPPHVNRATSAHSHMMSNLGQPSGLPQQQHPGGMQGPIHQAPFNGSMLAHHPSQQLQGTSPHAGTHSQNHTPANFGPNMPMSNVPPSQTPANRSQPPGEMLVGFTNQHMQPSLPHVPRIPQTGNNFPFAPPSTSPNPPGDMSQNVGGGQMNGSVHGPGPHHHITTPAQLVDRMSTQPSDAFSVPFNIPQSQSQPNVPTRPLSQQRVQHPGMFPQQPQLPHHQSPRPDPMTQHMAQRPQSQQGQQRPSPPQSGPSRTPRVLQQQLPNARIPIQPTGQNHQGPPQQGQQPQIQGQGVPGAPAQPPHPQQTAQRQQQSGPPSQGGPPQIAVPTQSQLNGTQHLPQSAHATGPPAPSIMRPQQSYAYLIGQGQAIARILQMSGEMALEKRSKEIPFWEAFVKKYFIPDATMKITLWKDNQRQEAKPFEIGTPILPRFFNVTTQSGVKSMSLTLDGARERVHNGAEALVECPDTLWTFRYDNGYTIVLKGPFTARVKICTDPPPASNPHAAQNYSLRIEHINFDSMTHQKLIDLEDIEGHRVASSPSAPLTYGDVDPRYELPRWHLADASFPAEPINAFGVPQATMRCLELAESVTQMGDLIQFSQVSGLGPKEALSRFAQRLREEMRGKDHGPDGLPKHSAQPSLPGPIASSNVLDGVNGGIVRTPPSSLYPGTPSSSAAQPGQAPSTPQNTAHAESSKQVKGSQPSNAGQGSSQTMASTPSASTPAAAPTPGGSTTPALANATLKRKAGQRADPESPAIANTDAPPPAKRATRKRPRTGTQGGAG